VTRADLIGAIRGELDISKKEAGILLEIILGSVVRALQRGDRVELRRFGTFATRVRRARKGRNPATGFQVDVGPSRVPHFRPSEELKALLNRPEGAGPTGIGDACEEAAGLSH
jgi:nucleoid DNA-binding protein